MSRLQSLYKVLKMQHGRTKYQKRKLDVHNITDVRYARLRPTAGTPHATPSRNFLYVMDPSQASRLDFCLHLIHSLQVYSGARRPCTSPHLPHVRHLTAGHTSFPPSIQRSDSETMHFQPASPSPYS